MNELYFIATKKRFEEAGLKIINSEYHSSAFGSCYIELIAKPNCRFVWDGKDGWFVIQQETEEVYYGSRVWKEVWTSEKSEETGYQQAFEKTIEYCNANA